MLSVIERSLNRTVTHCSSVDIVTRVRNGRPNDGKSIRRWPLRPGVPVITHTHQHTRGHPIHINHKSSTHTHTWTLVHITEIILHSQGDVNREEYKINTFLCIIYPWGYDLSRKHVGSSMCVDDLRFYINYWCMWKVTVKMYGTNNMTCPYIRSLFGK